MTMFSIGLRYTLVRSVSSNSNNVYRHALPTFSAYVASRSFVATGCKLEETKDALKQPAKKAVDKKTPTATKKEPKEKKDDGKAAAKKLREQEIEGKKQARERELREKEKARKLALKEKEKAMVLMVKETARKRMEKAKLDEVRLFKVLTRTTRPPFKKPLQPFQNFLRTELQGLPATDAGTYRTRFGEIARKWPTLPEEEKAKYVIDGLEEATKEYRAKYQEWKRNLTRRQRKAFSARHMGGSSRTNAYSLYCKEHFPKDLSGTTFGQASKDTTASYMALSDAEKAVWEKRAADLRAEYHAAQEKPVEEKESATV